MRNKSIAFVAAILLSAAAILAVPSLPVRAEGTGFVYSNPQTGYSIYIEDEEDLLTQDEESALIEDMIPLTEYGNVGFVSCEVYSTSTRSYSAQKYSQIFGSESGSMLVIDMGNRLLYLKNDGAVSKTITDAYSNTITDNIFRYASDGKYYECASACFKQVLTLLAGGRIAQPMRYITAALLALILGLMINFLILRAVSAPRKAGNQEIIDAAKVDFILRNANAVHDHTTKVYSPIKTSGGGGGSRGGGGGFSGGGSGGGHRF